MVEWGPIVQVLGPVIGVVPPWVLLSLMLGLVSASAFYLVLGIGIRSLPTYLALGLLAGPLAQFAGSSFPLPAPPLSIGEVHLAVVAGGTWSLLAIARLLRL